MKIERHPENPDINLGVDKALSIADGIGGFRHTLQRAGLLDGIKEIHSSEIDPYANAINQNNNDRYPGVELIPVGDIQKIDNDYLVKHGIKLVAGGPPCQQFSLLNPHAQGLDSESGSVASKFMNIVRVAKDYGIDPMFLMEETRMSDKNREIVSQKLGEIFGHKGPMYPTKYDARNSAPMSRIRNYWMEGFKKPVHNVTDPDFNEYKKYDENTNYRSEDIFNQEYDKDDTLESLVESGKIDYENPRFNKQEDWHPMTPWAPTVVATMSRYDNPKSLNYGAAKGRVNPVVRAIGGEKDTEFPFMWDPQGKYNSRSKLLPAGMGRIMDDKIYINNDPRPSEPYNMKPGELYETRIPNVQESELLFGYPVGYTDISPEQRQQISDLIGNTREIRNKLIRKHNLVVNKRPSNVPVDDWYKARDADRGALQHYMEQYLAGMPEEMRDKLLNTNSWLNYVSPTGLSNPQIHALGNGWQTNATELLMRLASGRGGHPVTSSDRRMKNILSAVTRRF